MYRSSRLSGISQGPTQELTIGDEVTDEPPEEDSEFSRSFEIISDEEVARLSSWTLSSSSSSTTISSKGSGSSLGSSGTGEPSPVITKGFSRNNNNSLPNYKMNGSKDKGKLKKNSPEDRSSNKSCRRRPPELSEEEMENSTARIWYIIQLEGYYNHGLEESDEIDDCLFYHPHPRSQYPSTTDDSEEEKTGWLHSLLRFPERIRQIQADKRRFNVHALSDEQREELKHLYVY